MRTMPPLPVRPRAAAQGRHFSRQSYRLLVRLGLDYDSAPVRRAKLRVTG